MGDADSTLRKASAQAEAAERDLKLTERAAAAARERAQRAKLVLKKAKKDSKRAAKAARKARKAADAASAAFTKATARVTKAQAHMSATHKAKRKRVTEPAATTGGATKSAAKKRSHRTVIARAAKRPRPVAPVPARATEPAVSTVEPLGESETFVLGESPLN